MRFFSALTRYWNTLECFWTGAVITATHSHSNQDAFPRETMTSQLLLSRPRRLLQKVPRCFLNECYVWIIHQLFLCFIQLTANKMHPPSNYPKHAWLYFSFPHKEWKHSGLEWHEGDWLMTIFQFALCTFPLKRSNTLTQNIMSLRSCRFADNPRVEPLHM